jgi:hypothetical protein
MRASPVFGEALDTAAAFSVHATCEEKQQMFGWVTII